MALKMSRINKRTDDKEERVETLTLSIECVKGDGKNQAILKTFWTCIDDDWRRYSTLIYLYICQISCEIKLNMIVNWQEKQKREENLVLIWIENDVRKNNTNIESEIQVESISIDSLVRWDPEYLGTAWMQEIFLTRENTFLLISIHVSCAHRWIQAKQPHENSLREMSHEL